MVNIEKLKFHILEVSGNNYLSWYLDVEMHLQRQGLANAIIIYGNANDKDKANALIFIHRHLHESLKTQYLSVRDPQILWTRLKESSNTGSYQFKTYSELISVLLTAKQTNELLLKNHDLRPASSKALLEANASFGKSTGRFNGRDHRLVHNPRNGGRRYKHPRQINLDLNHDNGKKPKNEHDESPVGIIDGLGNATIVLPNGTTLHIEDALLSSRSKKNLLSYKDVRRTGHHLETIDEQNKEFLCITSYKMGQKTIHEKLEASTK
ncbi:PREDICTED: uncharacterized protein LOC108663281 [Theobroma cacao]|uniref:Uncharacterized protein LOC108663281 n=1 Tax=Theobroma cacao TaxID=3641 RepID=A0AB32WRI5_THECC|nr:PREDICTED: uncharacterized protein LOC108663281 [Theobroma cacao]